MITTDNIVYLRELFANPDHFIQEAVQHAIKYNYSGFDLDFEPQKPTGNSHDAILYAEFIDKLAKELHKHGKM